MGVSSTSKAKAKKSKSSTRSKGLKKTRKKSTAKLRTELDKIWSERIKSFSGHKCRKCGSPLFVQSHHIFTKKAYPAGRFMLANGIALCRSCHFSAHIKPEEFRFFLIGFLGGEDKMRELHNAARQTFQFRRTDYDDIKSQLEGVSHAEEAVRATDEN